MVPFSLQPSLLQVPPTSEHAAPPAMPVIGATTDALTGEGFTDGDSQVACSYKTTLAAPTESI